MIQEQRAVAVHHNRGFVRPVSQVRECNLGWEVDAEVVEDMKEEELKQYWSERMEKVEKRDKVILTRYFKENGCGKGKEK